MHSGSILPFLQWEDWDGFQAGTGHELAESSQVPWAHAGGVLVRQQPDTYVGARARSDRDYGREADRDR